MDEPISGWTLTETSRAIREGRVSAMEVTRACLDQIRRFDGELGAVADLDVDRALAQAQRADEQSARRAPTGMVHGVPLAHKDMFYRLGRPCGWGAKVASGFVPDCTATVLDRLDRAGAIDLCRLNMVGLALGPTGHNDYTGTPRNPWNTRYVPGGSSSGSGVAVAARYVYGSLGSDTGGSIRHPAYCCGLVGIKPTLGRVSRFGSMPLSSSLDHVGVLARTVDDCAMILQVIAGHDVEDPSTSRRPVPDYLGNGPRSLKDLRVAVPRNWFHDRVDYAVLGHLEESIRVFRQEGATIVDTTIPAEFELASPLASLVMAVETAMVHGQKLLNDPEAFSPAQYRRLIAGIYYPATRYLEALALRGQVTRIFCESVFRSADVLHVPSVPVPVPTIEETDLGSDPAFGAFVERFTGFNRPFNFMGLPTLCLPAGLDANGLPVGFQLVGRPFSEQTLFHAGRTFEAATGFGRVIPPLIAARPGSGPGWIRTDVQSDDHFAKPFGSPQH